MPKTLLGFCLSLLLACTQAPTTVYESAVPEQDQRQAFARIADLARHEDLQEMRVDDIGWDDFADRYTALDSASFKVLWPDSNWVAGLGDYDHTFVHGWKELDKEHVLLSLITMGEDSYCITIVCDLRARDGRSLGTFDAAERCGDGGWTYHAYGRFDGAWSFVRTSLETDMQEVDSNYVETYACDSVVDRISFAPKGGLKYDQISANHFERVEHPQTQD
jgi:hypothetical protein